MEIAVLPDANLPLSCGSEAQLFGWAEGINVGHPSDHAIGHIRVLQGFQYASHGFHDASAIAQANAPGVLAQLQCEKYQRHHDGGCTNKLR